MKRAAGPHGGLGDSALVELCLGGDASAWEGLVARYRRLVYSVPIRMGLKAEDADEVFQETFTTLLAKLSTVRDRERIGLWLGVTARRKALDLVKRSPYAREVALQIDERLTSPAPLADEALVALERDERVRRAVDLLPERCRRLLRALYVEDPPLSYRELAEKLGVPSGSLGPTRMRCFERLRRQLGDMK